MSSIVDDGVSPRVGEAIETDGEVPPDTVGENETPEGPARRGMRLWVLALVYAGAAFAATATSSPGRWIADARLEFSSDPVGFLAGHQHLWDDTRGMGNTATWYSPVLGSFQAIVSRFVSEPWMVERLVHTLLLTTAATSMVFLVSVVVPRISWLHLVAGLVFAFNPYTSQFLLPSGLFLSYAISPLLVAAFLRGVSARGEAWRMAALFALAIFSVGALNTAALVYAGLPMLVALVYLVLIERSVTWTAVGAWVGRALLLTIGVSAAALVVLWMQRGDVALNLATTERPAVVSNRSSWAESWRGLGLWLTYFRDAFGPLRPQAAPYFENRLVVLASYAAPTAAIVVLVLSRWRPRYFFGALVGMGALLMVGLWPVGAPSPFGRLLEWSFDNAVVLRGLRTTYKAGAVLYIGVAVLAAVAVTHGLRGRRVGSSVSTTRGWAGRVTSAALAAAFCIAAVPFWTGGLYNDADSFEEIPEYWSETIDWLNDQPADGRVMVLPGAVRARYRWGYINDNLFHGLLDKSLVAHQAIPPPGAPVGADVVRHLDEYIASADFVPGSLGPILRRLGVRWVVFQNDLEWSRLGVGRPASFDDVRSDPALRPVASFGDAGQNTTSPTDPTASALGEDLLPPVEVYEVVDGSDTIRLTPDPALVVSGGGDAWPQLSLAGLLDGGPVAYSSLMDDDELGEAVADGSSVVITDGGRRRAMQVSTGRMAMSHTLGAEEEYYRDPISPFPIEGQSVTVFPDASTIEATVVGRGLLPFDPAIRPALAFDGREDTAWEVSGPLAEGAALEVELLEETEIDEVRVVPVVRTAGRFAQVVRLELEDSEGVTREFVTQVDASEVGAPVVFEAGGSPSVSLRLTLEDVTGQEAVSLGVSEVEVIGSDRPLDLREFVQTPVDLREAAERSPAVASALFGADVGLSFSRSIGTGAGDEEVDIRRRFWSPRAIESPATGTVRLSSATPDQAVDHLLAGDVGAVGSDRVSGLDGWGVNAVDGDASTAWLGVAAEGSSLTVRPPPGGVEEISVVTVVSRGVGAREAAFSTIEELQLVLETEDGPVVIDMDRNEVECSDGEGLAQCTRTFDASVPADDPALDAREFRVEALDVIPEVGAFAIRPIAISEVLFDGAAASTAGWGEDCVDGLIVDGRTVPIRLEGPVDRLLAGDPVPFITCGELEIMPGDGTFETVPALSGAVSDVLIARAPQSTTTAADPSEPGSVTVLERTPTRVVVSVDASAAGALSGGSLVGPGSFHPGWRAFVDGEPLASAGPLDAMSGWTLAGSSLRGADGSDIVVTFEFRPQRTYELALAISLATVALSLVLLVGGRRRRAS